MVRIQIDNVHYEYPGGVKALAGVSLTIEAGESVALLGRNGSGKTTLARHLNGLLRPQTGQVLIGDWQTSRHSPAQMARRVAYTFQNPDEQLFRQKVWDEAAFGPQNLGCSSDQVSGMVAAALESVELKGAAGMNPRDLGLSGRKLVGLASALAMGTPVLVLDEPTAGLDAREQDLAAKAITGLKQAGKTILTITHDMDFAAENFDRFVLMDQGRVVLDRPAEDFFAEKDILERAGLAAPQIVRLCDLLGHERGVLTVSAFLENEKTRQGL